MSKSDAGKGDDTVSRTDFRAYQSGWDRLNKAVAAEKSRKEKRK